MGSKTGGGEEALLRSEHPLQAMAEPTELTARRRCPLLRYLVPADDGHSFGGKDVQQFGGGLQEAFLDQMPACKSLQQQAAAHVDMTGKCLGCLLLPSLELLCERRNHVATPLEKRVVGLDDSPVMAGDQPPKLAVHHQRPRQQSF